MASYSALGRIRKVLVFDNSSVYNDEMRNPYINFCQKLLRDYEIDLYVFSDAVIADSSPITFVGNTYVKIHFEGRKKASVTLFQIDTFWTQDTFVIVKPKQFVYLNTTAASNRTFIFKYLQEKIPELVVEKWEQSIDGGNLLLGKGKQQDYILIGPNKHNFNKKTKQYKEAAEKVNIPELASAFGIPPERVFQLWDYTFDANRFYDFCYHADLFYTIAGPNQEQKELILYAQLIDCTGSMPDLEDMNSILTTRAEKLKREMKNQDDEIAIEPLPMYIFNYTPRTSKPRWDNLIFNFNNMFVENYEVMVEDKKVRKRIAYIPDYLTVWEAFVGKESTNQQLINNVAYNIYKANNTLTSPSLAFTLDTALPSENDAAMSFQKKSREEQLQLTTDTITQITKEVKQKLVDYGFDEVIELGFRQFQIRASNYPSALHCSAKVVERDRIT